MLFELVYIKTIYIEGSCKPRILKTSSKLRVLSFPNRVLVLERLLILDYSSLQHAAIFNKSLDFTMTNININIIIILLLSVLEPTESKCFENKKKSHLWKLTEAGRNNPIFLFGTIHVAWSDVWHDGTF